MNTVQRFFRRYIFSTIGIVILFLVVNIALLFAIIIAGGMSGADTSFSVRDFSDHVVLRDGKWVADDTALSMLQEQSAWAMLLNEAGDVVWQQDLPEKLPRSYTSTEVASFSRWYLEDYPVKIWTRADGNLMVVGYQPGTLVKYYFSLEWPSMGGLLGGIAAVFIINLLLIVFLILRNTRKVEKAMTPILQGIQNLSHGKAPHLEEQGELAEINAGLNRAADYMRKKDNTRAEWIRGVSHDIRTPLSMVLGYASELEDDRNLPPEARKQASIIRRESEKMKRLIDDLNLTTKLEYALQPVHFKDVDWVETSRQAVSEVLNSGLDSRYEIVFSEMQPGRSIHLLGDDGLLRRLLDNLIRNSITHNPQGCRISVSVGEENGRYLCVISDDGVGIAPERLKALNRGDGIASTQGNDEKAEHGLGLKLVVQIVKAHRGTVSFSGNTPHGLEVRISLPPQPLIS
ncbi:sensor histidine kinase [Blautia obeum]|uniref:sensor histidine kinase n=1 Tax=Blautia obeum TaxID=40520 RepID=UPI000E4DA0EB|nr:HAMP domain-containing sensor histidine kinase [Blautia obeum]RHA48814.1 sensor histidine kinase [Blautia obeum]